MSAVYVRKGLIQGRIEGRIQGARDELRWIVSTQLRVRFPDQDHDGAVAAYIGSAKPGQLRRLAVLVGGSTDCTWDQAQRRLSVQSRKKSDQKKKVRKKLDPNVATLPELKLQEGLSRGRAAGRTEGALHVLRWMVNTQLKLRFPEQLQDGTVAARIDSAEADPLRRVAVLVGRSAGCAWPQVQRALPRPKARR